MVTANNLLANPFSFHFSNNTFEYVGTCGHNTAVSRFWKEIRSLSACLMLSVFTGDNTHVSWKQSPHLATFLLSHWEYEPCLIVCLLHISRGSYFAICNILFSIFATSTNYCSNKSNLPLHGVHSVNFIIFQVTEMKNQEDVGLSYEF